MKKALLISFALLNLVYYPFVFGQYSADAKTSASDVQPCFYVDVNKLQENKSIDIPLSTICLEYHDKYGKDEALKLELYDGNNDLVRQMHLKKKYGKNNFTLDLEKLGLRENESYYLHIENEFRKKYAFTFKVIPPPDKPDPLVDIFVNPILLECQKPEGNLIEFYGSIEGGKAPYEVKWVLMAENSSSLIYQPKELRIEKSGYTPTIQVDQSPNYVVVLKVKDACGNEGSKTVNVACDKVLENSDNLFFQPLPEDSGQPNINVN